MIKGERLNLRSVEHNDIKLLWKWENDPDIAYYDGADVGRTVSMEEVKDRLDEERTSLTEKTYMIELHSGKPIGTISYYDLSIRNRNCSVAIKIGDKDYWGKGYGTEAMKALLGFLFIDLNLHRVQLQVVDYNDRAMASYRKCGFQVEGRSREFYFVRGEWHNQITMGILAREFHRVFVDSHGTRHTQDGARVADPATARIHLVA